MIGIKWMGTTTTAKQEPKTTPIRKGLQGVLDGARGRCEGLAGMFGRMSG